MKIKVRINIFKNKYPRKNSILNNRNYYFKKTIYITNPLLTDIQKGNSNFKNKLQN